MWIVLQLLSTLHLMDLYFSEHLKINKWIKKFPANQSAPIYSVEVNQLWFSFLYFWCSSRVGQPIMIWTNSDLLLKNYNQLHTATSLRRVCWLWAHWAYFLSSWPLFANTGARWAEFVGLLVAFPLQIYFASQVPWKWNLFEFFGGIQN